LRTATGAGLHLRAFEFDGLDGWRRHGLGGKKEFGKKVILMGFARDDSNSCRSIARK
jgi:hypothetical protein